MISKVFKKELGYFTLHYVRDFVLYVFDNLCPDYFWYIRASQRGHHHPLMQTRGGLVHHTKLAVRFAASFCEMYGSDLSEKRFNQIIAATLMHDMMKRGAVENELQTWSNHKEAARSHGRYCADKIHEKIFDYKAIPIDYLPIIEAVRLHMGRWTWDVTETELFTLEKDIVCRTVHLADYAASRSLHKWLGERYTDESMGYLK